MNSDHQKKHIVFEPFTYTVETLGAKKIINHPFVVAVFSDLSGDNPNKPIVSDKRLLEIDIDCIDARIKQIEPILNLQVPNSIDESSELVELKLRFDSITDFDPQGIVKQVEPLRKLQVYREQLEQLSLRLEVKPKFTTEISNFIRGLYDSDSASFEYKNTVILNNIDLSNEKLINLSGILWGGADVANMFSTLNYRIVQRHFFPDVPIDIAILRAAEDIDKLMSSQLCYIMHHPKFQELEAAWRGLYYLAKQFESSKKLKIHVMDISKKELTKTFIKFSGTSWDQSPIIKAIYNTKFGIIGEEPYGLMLCDYLFTNDEQDIKVLHQLSKIGRISFAPVIVGALPSLFCMDSWDELSIPRNLEKIFSITEYAEWRCLCENNNSQYLMISLSRLLTRQAWADNAYNSRHMFKFIEEIRDKANLTWMNGAFGIASIIMNNYDNTNSFHNINGSVANQINYIPSHNVVKNNIIINTFGPVEANISLNRVFELEALGFIGLVQCRSQEFVALISPTVVRKAIEFNDPIETQNEKLKHRFAYILHFNRIAIILKCQIRDKIDGNSNVLIKSMQESLNLYISKQILLEDINFSFLSAADVFLFPDDNLSNEIHIKLVFANVDSVGERRYINELLVFELKY
jgi:type VI secretion system ImpC/EvpB family protein/type VI secretion system ImpB/VipA family protein